MRYRRFGKSDLEVSEVGFGVWTLASDWWGRIDDPRGMLHAARDAGITFIDTAPVYGDNGVGETLLADLLKSDRSEIVLTTKCGYDIDSPRPESQSERRQDWEPASVRAQLEASLRRLGTDYIDLYQLHNAAARSDPRRRALGRARPISCRRQGARARRRTRPRHRVGRRRARRSARAPHRFAADRLQRARAGTRAHVRGRTQCRRGARRSDLPRPHASDTLSGKITRDTEFPPGDHRAHRNRENMLDNFDKAETLAFLWGDTGRTIGQAAIAGILANPAFTTVLPTCVSIDDVREYAAASDLPLTDDERAQLEERWNDNFGVTNRYEMPLKSSAGG